MGRVLTIWAAPWAAPLLPHHGLLHRPGASGRPWRQVQLEHLRLRLLATAGNRPEWEALREQVGHLSVVGNLQQVLDLMGEYHLRPGNIRQFE